MEKSELCPVCKTAVPTRKSHNLPLREPADFRGAEIILHRLREKVCPTCGNAGSTDIFIARTIWEKNSPG